MKRDIELQKPVAHSSIWLGKRVSDCILKVNVHSKRPKACSSKRNVIYHSHNERWLPLKDQKDQMLCLKVESNEKLQVMFESSKTCTKTLLNV